MMVKLMVILMLLLTVLYPSVSRLFLGWRIYVFVMTVQVLFMLAYTYNAPYIFEMQIIYVFVCIVSFVGFGNC